MMWKAIRLSRGTGSAASAPRPPTRAAPANRNSRRPSISGLDSPNHVSKVTLGHEAAEDKPPASWQDREHAPALAASARQVGLGRSQSARSRSAAEQARPAGRGSHAQGHAGPRAGTGPDTAVALAPDARDARRPGAVGRHAADRTVGSLVPGEQRSIAGRAARCE